MENRNLPLQIDSANGPAVPAGPFRPKARQRGMVLVIVLSFIVMLTVLVVAFFTRSITTRQMAAASANRVEVDLFGEGAVDTIISDLKQEIVANSNTFPLPSGTLYIPKKPADMMPAISGKLNSGNTLHPNLLKQSASQQPAYTGGPTRASSISTTTPSMNGRFISPARWNKPLLLTKLEPTDATDLTPQPSGNEGFTPPDWILVSRDGTNPTAFSQSMGNSAVSNDRFVIGRYAYNIYHEGGLLDMNAAGIPTSIFTALAVPEKDAFAYKNWLAFTDLKVLPGISDLPTARQDEVISAISGWRNNASLKPAAGSPWYKVTLSATAGADFLKFLRASTAGFLTTTPAMINGSTSTGMSDKFFSTRQELIQFVTQGLTSDDAERANLQKAMQYMSHFSRDLNQPSLVPASSQGGPTIVSTNGGNNAAGFDTVINPTFLQIRAGSAFSRFDPSKTTGLGTAAKAEEPLVLKRFSLNRLAWITYAGPITLNGTSYNPAVNAAYITALKTNYGFTDAFLWQGTPRNIYNSFGLSWVTATTASGPVGLWVYSHNGSTPLTAVPGSGTPIKALSNVPAANREADFVELLKASITAGSIAKGATDNAGAPVEIAQYNNDITLDYSILRIAANIIDQFDGDGYPTVIRFTPDTTAGTRDLRGIEDLPYYYRSFIGLVQSAMPVPLPTTDWTDNVTPGYDGPAPALTNAGFYTALLESQIWNPHDQNGSTPTLKPTAFRFMVDSAPLDANGTAIAAYNTVSIRAVAAAPNSGAFSTGADLTKSPPFYNNYAEDPVPLTAATTELTFSIPSGNKTLFREPTLLLKPGIPTGSNLTIGAGNYLKTKFAPTPYATYFPGDGVKALNNITSDGKSYLGTYLGVAPLRWTRQPAGSGPPPARIHSAHRQTVTMSANNPDPAVTFRLQYQNASGQWVTYDEKYGRFSTTAGWLVVDNAGLPDTEASVGDRPASGDFRFGNRAGENALADPRTSRFGMAAGWRGNANAWILDDTPSPDVYIPWLNKNENILGSLRPDSGISATAGYLDAANPTNFWGLPKVAGWHPTSGGRPNWILGGGKYRPGFLSQNNPLINPSSYYSDADGVVRRAMGAYWATTTTPTTLGLPMANTLVAAPTTQPQSRPLILNRPFKSVTELGYVFSDIPWRNLDMFTPESGFAGLLDVFSIGENGDSTGMIAGKVNLNTRQAPVLQAIISGGYRDALNAGTGVIAGATASSLAATAADALVSRTTATTTDKGPLTNVSDLVGRWVSNKPLSTGGFDGSASYSGFSGDLSTAITAASYSAADKANDQTIQRFREATMRALASSGQARVWNLMIDVVAQTGRYPTNANDVNRFVVEGEQRYWVHVAIDRLTGQVIDKQMEVVKE